MDLKQLTHLLAVRDAGPLPRRPTGCNVAQPAISMAIAKLEQQLELRLFDRQIATRLTPEGRCSAAMPSACCARCIRPRPRWPNPRGWSAERCASAFPHDGPYYFPPILMAFKHRYPGLKIRVEEAGTRELLSRMVDGSLDPPSSSPAICRRRWRGPAAA